MAVVRPVSEAQVADLVQLCVARGWPIVVQGANTGLVGAATPDGSGGAVVLSTERMRSIRDLRLDDMTVRASPGTRLSELNEFLRPHGLWLPIDLGADPSIGGMVATNTGGTRLMQYGDMRTRVGGLRVVTMSPAGQILDLGKGLQKDNAALDLKQLFIGSSGSMGIVTEVTLHLAPLPRQSAVALVALDSPSYALELYRSLMSRCAGVVTAFEGVSGEALDLALRHVPGLRMPFAEIHPYCVLVELSSTMHSEDFDVETLLMRLLEGEYGKTIREAVIGKAEQLWRIRHSLSEGLRASGEVMAFDVSVRRDLILEFLAEARALVKNVSPEICVADFGHWGDGGMHFNLVLPKQPEVTPRIREILRQSLYALVVEEFGGSFSAEHGLGPSNLDVYERFTPVEQKKLAGQFQALLNPGLCLGRVDFQQRGPA
jgi:FAD/FMN-containing dehydrogenase